MLLQLSPASIDSLRSLVEQYQTGDGAVASSSTRNYEEDDALISQLKLSLDGSKESETLPSQPEGVISHDLLIRASVLFSHRYSSASHITLLPPPPPPPSLDVLLRNSAPWFPPKKAFIRSPQLEATLSRIRLQQERREYAEMINPTSSTNDPTKGSRGNTRLFSKNAFHTTNAQTTTTNNNSDYSGTNPPPPFPPQTEEEEWLEIRRQLSAVANVLISGLAVALAAWWACGEYASPEGKVAISSLAALVIVAAEAFLYVRQLGYVKEKEQRRRRGLSGKLTLAPALTPTSGGEQEDKDKHTG